MFSYNDNGKLKRSMLPIEGLTLVNITDEQARNCEGFDENGNIIYRDDTELNKSIEIKQINLNFENECKNIGVEFTGTFNILNSEETIVNPRFQYDDESQTRLFKFKDITECNFWRSVHSTDSTKNNVNVILTNQQKNDLYTLLLSTWGNKFLEKSIAIDSL